MLRAFSAIVVVSTYLFGVAHAEQEKQKPSDNVAPLVSLVAENQIFFPKSSAYLRLAESKKLELLAKALKQAPEETLIISGKTDHRGDHKFNSWLREERSTAVADRLASLGIETSQFVITEHPAEDDPKPSGSAAQMRRVDFSLKGHEEAIARHQATGVEKKDSSPAEVKATQNDASKYRKLRKSDSRLNPLRQLTEATHIYFEHTSTSVRSEYWRDLKQLADLVLATPDGALAISGFASPSLPNDEAKQLGNRRCVGAAAKLNALGVSWDRILILPASGESSYPAPDWRNHRIDFSARVMLDPPKASLVANQTSIPRARPTRSDSLSTLAEQAVIYFGADSDTLKEVDRRALKEIARILSSEHETRTLVIQTFIKSSDSDEETRKISERRQNAVMDFLVQNDAPSDRLLLQTQTMTAQESAGPNWKQRRVQLLVQEG